jgi:transposase
MRTGRPRSFEIKLSDHEREELTLIGNSRTQAHSIVRRARIILLSAEGVSSAEIARRVGLKDQSVAHWRKRFRDNGLSGLYDLPKSGHPRTFDDEKVTSLIDKVRGEKPDNATHWSVREAAKATGMSKSSVQRYFSLFGLQPHRTKSFKISTDPNFVDKVFDIVGLYLNPPDSALVLCVDEKSQIQALERTQPILPMGLGYVEGVTHDYYRHGTTTLFAALDIKSGEVITQCKARHRHEEFLSFLRHVDENVPENLDLHLVMDNYSTHKHPAVRKWLADRPRYHVHFTPTYSSWLNQVERWFGLITEKAIRRDSFNSVKTLIERIQNFVSNYNKNSRPFFWSATAESIMAKLSRLSSLICGTPH